MNVLSLVATARTKLAAALSGLPWRRQSEQLRASGISTTADLSPIATAILEPKPRQAMLTSLPRPLTTIRPRLMGEVDFLDAMARGPAYGVAVSLMWDIAAPSARDRELRRFQARMVKHARDWTRRHGLPNTFIASSLKRNSRSGAVVGRLFVQAPLGTRGMLLVAMRDQLLRRHGATALQAFKTGGSGGLISSVAEGFFWLRHRLFGNIRADGEMQMIDRRWGCGRAARERNQVSETVVPSAGLPNIVH